MRALQAYILKQLIVPYLAILAGLMLVGILAQSLTQLDLMVERGQSPLVLLEIALLGTPKLLAILSPVALFSACANVYARLQRDNELVVGQSMGQSLISLSMPALVLASISALVILGSNLFLQPYCFQKMRAIIHDIKADFATTLVREGQFRNAADGLTIYVRRIDRGAILNGLVISDTRSENQPLVYEAAVGRIDKLENVPVIILSHGTVQRRLADGQVQMVGFGNYAFALGSFMPETDKLVLREADRYLPALLRPDGKDKWAQENRGSLLGEANRRFASPLIGFSAVLLAIYAIIGGSFSRLGYSRRIGIAAGELMLLLLILAGSEDVFAKAAWTNFFQYSLPISVALAILWFMHRGAFAASPLIATSKPSVTA